MKDYLTGGNRWAVSDKGIYFVEPSGSIFSLKFLDFGTGRVTEIFQFEKPLASSAFAISPNGRWLLYSQIDQSGDDLMLVENFQ